MAKVCDICGKTYNKAQYINKLRGKYNPSGIKIQRPNLQKKKIDGVAMILCTNCIKSMTKTKRTRKPATVKKS